MISNEEPDENNLEGGSVKDEPLITDQREGFDFGVNSIGYQRSSSILGLPGDSLHCPSRLRLSRFVDVRGTSGDIDSTRARAWVEPSDGL